MNIALDRRRESRVDNEQRSKSGVRGRRLAQGRCTGFARQRCDVRKGSKGKITTSWSNANPIRYGYVNGAKPYWKSCNSVHVVARPHESETLTLKKKYEDGSSARHSLPTDRAPVSVPG
ncbi:predicted protein [Coccidioides posadasii str. Silveira]|uniref:Predicted protein n=1 Tax=Coccidioides posadasii (strain RMSCC 757 / Silveira) TaxID=443226 RepID=E9D956_COCPS|nr:predicted protein [Coccidioides posadasii str. Silveira]